MHPKCLAPALLLVCLAGCDNKTPAQAAEQPPKSSPAKTEAKPEKTASAKPAPAQAKAPAAEVEHDKLAAAGSGFTTANLLSFCPLALRGVKRKSMGSGGVVAAAYMLKDDKPRFVNITIAPIKDLAFEKAQFRVHKDGETRDGNGRELLAKMIGGRLVQRSFSTSMGSSEVRVLVDEALAVRVFVEHAKNADEAFEFLKHIDLDALGKLAPS